MKATPRAPGARAGLRILLLSIAAGWPLAASAYRPFDSTDASVADKGELELELGPVGYVIQGPKRDVVAPSLVANWGFADRWEAVLEGRHFVRLAGDVQEPRLRVEDSSLTLKRVLRDGVLQGRAGPSVATEFGALLPNVHGDPGLGAIAFLLVSQRWPDLTVHWNVAAEWTRAHEPGSFVGLILEAHDAWAVRPVAEVFVESERGSTPTASGLLGAIWRASGRLSFDAAVRVARAGSVRTTELRLGLTWGFGVGFPT